MNILFTPITFCAPMPSTVLIALHTAPHCILLRVGHHLASCYILQMST